MKKLLLLIFLALFFSNTAFSQDLSSIIIDKFFEEGQKVCKEEGLGEYLLTNNPITSIDISNDGINDLIIDESTQRCEKSYSILRVVQQEIISLKIWKKSLACLLTI